MHCNTSASDQVLHWCTGTLHANIQPWFWCAVIVPFLPLLHGYNRIGINRSWLMRIPLCLIALFATEWQSKTNRRDDSHVALKHRWRQLIDGDVLLAGGDAWAGVWTWRGHGVLPAFLFLSFKAPAKATDKAPRTDCPLTMETSTKKTLPAARRTRVV